MLKRGPKGTETAEDKGVIHIQEVIIKRLPGSLTFGVSVPVNVQYAPPPAPVTSSLLNRS